MCDNVFITIGVGLVTGLTGLLVGNRLAIGRDKRKEFNAIVEPIRISLMKEKENPTPYAEIPDKISLTLFRESLPFYKFYKRRAFDRALERYQKTKSDYNQQQNSVGEVSYKYEFLIVKNIEKLLTIIKPK